MDLDPESLRQLQQINLVYAKQEEEKNLRLVEEFNKKWADEKEHEDIQRAIAESKQMANTETVHTIPFGHQFGTDRNNLSICVPAPIYMAIEHITNNCLPTQTTVNRIYVDCKRTGAGNIGLVPIYVLDSMGIRRIVVNRLLNHVEELKIWDGADRTKYSFRNMSLEATLRIVLRHLNNAQFLSILAYGSHFTILFLNGSYYVYDTHEAVRTCSYSTSQESIIRTICEDLAVGQLLTNQSNMSGQALNEFNALVQVIEVYFCALRR